MTDRRELRVVLFSDVVDSSRRMFEDEASAVALITRDLDLLRRMVLEQGGELIKSTGDGVLATFPTTPMALECVRRAVQVLQAVEGPRLQHRFGLHLGEIYVLGDDRFGEGVHLAARLQTISPPNGVAFTQATRDNLELVYRRQALPLGDVQLKGLPTRLPCYALPAEVFSCTLAASPSHSNGFSWFRARLMRSTPRQAIVTAGLLLLALAHDVDPSNPLSTYLLDRRLHIQKLWRQISGQPGPQRPAMPVVLLESTEPVIPRLQLTALLQQLPPKRYPRVALDVVIDQPGPDPVGTQQLIATITRQRREALFVGTFAARSLVSGAGRRSLPLAGLLQAGVQPRDLAIGTPAGPAAIKPLPLQLVAPLTADSMAVAVAVAGASHMPVDAVVDWSLDWQRMIRIVPMLQLESGTEPVLLVGRLSSGAEPDPDLFRTPAAFDQADPLWGGSAHAMPGVLLLAVMSQSLSLQHWLMPVPMLCCVAASAGAGVLLAAAIPGVRSRLRLLVLLLPLSGLLAIQLAVGSRALYPLLLPGVALASMALLRRD